jgi:tripartite-type tricarboxylate transporter receptor subunit TctC
MRERRIFAAALVALGLAAAPAAAQEFPTKPVSLMMPYAAGGPGDTITRIIGHGLSKAMGKQFVVENVAGAGGTIGTARVAAAAPDGHSLLVMHIGHATNVSLYRNLRYDAIKDFEPIGLIADSPMAIVAKKDFAPKDLKELIAYVKANKQKVSYGHAGIGSASHLCGLLLFSAIDAAPTTIPYKGTGPAMNDLVGGQFDFMCDQSVNLLQHVRSGTIKAYAASTPKRLPVLPDLPTASEAGLPGFSVGIWFAMYAPKGTPKPVLDKLSAALSQALDDPEVKEKLGKLGGETVGPERRGPEVLRAHLKAEIDRWGPVIKKAGVFAE